MEVLTCSTCGRVRAFVCVCVSRLTHDHLWRTSPNRSVLRWRFYQSDPRLRTRSSSTLRELVSAPKYAPRNSARHTTHDTRRTQH
jgi:hypothetical protein